MRGGSLINANHIGSLARGRRGSRHRASPGERREPQGSSADASLFGALMGRENPSVTKKGGSRSNRPNLHGQALKDAKHKIAVLKKKGIFSKRTDARKAPSRYALAKVKKFSDVLEGRAIAVPAKPAIRSKYEREGFFEAGSELRKVGRFIVAPKTAELQRLKIKQGKIQRETFIKSPSGLSDHWQTEIILPFHPRTMQALMKDLENHPELNNELKEGEQFIARIYGHNSTMGFSSIEDLREKLLTKYRHLFNPINNREAVKYFSLLKWSPIETGLRTPPPSPREGRIYNDGYQRGANRRTDAKGRNTNRRKERIVTEWNEHVTESAKERERARKRHAIANESPEARERRLERTRKYSRKYRARKRNGKK